MDVIRVFTGRLDDGPREGYLHEEMMLSQYPQIHLVNGFAKFFVTILLSYSLLKIQKQSRQRCLGWIASTISVGSPLMLRRCMI
ncbi:hypothetical protein ACA910_010512 [Epithemia clementina (nom. ined.)]